jgi:hypothetical protein
MEDILRRDLEDIDLRRRAGEIAEEAIAQSPAVTRHNRLDPPSRRLVPTTAVLAPGVSDSGRYRGDIHPSARNLRLALGDWFGRETRFTGNTIVEHRRLSFAMEIPSA